MGPDLAGAVLLMKHIVQATSAEPHKLIHFERRLYASILNTIAMTRRGSRAAAAVYPRWAELN